MKIGNIEHPSRGTKLISPEDARAVERLLTDETPGVSVSCELTVRDCSCGYENSVGFRFCTPTCDMGTVIRDGNGDRMFELWILDPEEHDSVLAGLCTAEFFANEVWLYLEWGDIRLCVERVPAKRFEHDGIGVLCNIDVGQEAKKRKKMKLRTLEEYR